MNEQNIDFQFYYAAGEETFIIGLTKKEKEILIKKYSLEIQNP